MKQTKQEMINLLSPMFAGSPLTHKKLAIELLKVNEEDPQDWIPDIAGWNDTPYQIVPPQPQPPTARFTIGWDDLVSDPEMKIQLAKKIGIDLPPVPPTPAPLFIPKGGTQVGTGSLDPNAQPAPAPATGGGPAQPGTGNNNAVAPTLIPRANISRPFPQGKSTTGGVGQLFIKH